MAWKRYTWNGNWWPTIHIIQLSNWYKYKLQGHRQQLKSHIFCVRLNYFQKNRKFDILKKDIDRNTVYKYWKYCHRQIPIKIYSYWNVNHSVPFAIVPRKRIKIYSYWNVNADLFSSVKSVDVIKIYSYWNVNNPNVLSFPLVSILKSTHTEM